MCIKVLHLRKDLTGNIVLPENCFYIGRDFLNLPQSPFYTNLNHKEYREWIWSKIKAKSKVYQQLLVIANSIIFGNDIILACSCDKANDCSGQIVKKAISYLLEQEKFSAQALEPSSWDEHTKLFSVAQDKLHDFSYWLISNNHHEEKLNFYELWLKFICQRQIA